MRKTLGSSILLLDLAVCYQCAQVHQTQLEHYTSSKRTKYHFHIPLQWLKNSYSIINKKTKEEARFDIFLSFFILFLTAKLIFMILQILHNKINNDEKHLWSCDWRVIAIKKKKVDILFPPLERNWFTEIQTTSLANLE